jgi:signal peptide peptidase SppA
MSLDFSALATQAAMAEALALFSTGERLFALDVARLGAGVGRGAPDVAAPASIALLRLHGSIRPRGEGGMEGFRSRVASIRDNPDIGAAVLDTDGPGGTVAGTPEAAAAIAELAAVKPVIAFIDTLAASATYWIASQASQVWLTPSGEVGSIGVRAMHLDVSKAMANNGMNVTEITSTDSPYKAEMSPFAPLSEDALSHIQARANAEHQNFINAVAKGRGVHPDIVRSDFGKGRTVGAEQAVRLGMADRIGSLSDAVASLRTKSGTVRRRTALAFR